MLVGVEVSQPLWKLFQVVSTYVYIIADWVISLSGINATKKDAYVSDGIYKIFIAIFFDSRNWEGLIFISGRINKYIIKQM